MTKRMLLLLSLTSLLVLAACGDEGSECGAGTVESGGECVPDIEEIECGDGTSLVDGACVPDSVLECGPGTEEQNGECVSTVEETECGPGTSLNDAGECVPDFEEVVCGDDTELVDGECVSTIELVECGEGTILIDGSCDLIDPFDGLDEEPGEPNDPFFEGTPGTMVLGADGETTVVSGNIDPATLFGEGEDAFLAPDFDVFVFENDKAGRRVSFEATAVGAPNIALAVIFLADEGDDREYVRLGFPFDSRNAFKEMVLPFEGAYMVRVGTDADTATFFNQISEGEFDFGGLAGDPTGAADFTWILGVTPLADKDAETFAGNATFTFEGDDVREAPQAFVDVDAGRIVALTLETAAGVIGSVNTSDADFNGYAENAGLVVVPEGGLSIVVDSIIDRSQDTSFTLTGVEQPLLDQGTLDPGGELVVEETLVGNSFQFVSFTTEVPMVVSVDAVPAEGSDANLGMVLLTPDLETGIAGSFDQLFGFFAPPSNEEFFEAFVAEPGTYLIQVFHEDLDEDNGDHPYTVTINSSRVLDFADLAQNDTQTIEEEDIANEGDTAFFSVNVTELGLLTVDAAPQALEENLLDLGLTLHDTPFLAARDQLIFLDQAIDGFEGETETIVVPTGAAQFLIRLTNDGLDAIGEIADVTVALGEIGLEVEPNDDAGEATDLGELGEEPTLTGGELALDVDTTSDFYTFDVLAISDVTLSVTGIGENPALDIRMSLFDADDISTPLAVEETFIDFFSGDAIDPSITITIEPGQYVVEIAQIDDAATGNYLFDAVVNEILDCVPGATACNGDNIELCVDGFELAEVVCSGNALCSDVGDTATCGDLTETEPNEDAGTATDLGAIGNDHTDAKGVFAEAGDVDFYGFTLDANAIVTIGTAFAGAPSPDTTLTLFSADDTENEIAFNDDGIGRGLFSLISDVELEAGSYIIRVGSFQDAGTGPYTLTFDVILAECNIDDPLACDGDDIVGCDGFNFGIVETCNFGCNDEGDAPICEEPEFLLETEPNDGFVGGNLTSTPIDELPATFQGNIDVSGDQDFYSFTTSGGVFTIETLAFGDPDVGDTTLAICNVEQIFSDEGCTFGGFDPGNNIDEDDDGGEGNYSLLTDIELGPGTFFIMVEGFGANVGGYLLTVEQAPAPGEPNDDFDSATPIEIDDSLDFAIDEDGDRDFYVFEVTQQLLDDNGGSIDIDFHTIAQERDDASTLDTVLLLCTDDQECTGSANSIARNDDGGPGNQGGLFYSQIINTFDTPGFFFVVVEELGNNGTGDYTLNVLNATP